MAAEDNEAEEILPRHAKKKEAPKKKKVVPPGGLMKAVVREGAGEKTPQSGDQVIFHNTTRTAEGVIVESTRAEYGGKGIPHRLVLGKSKMILGWEEAIPSMLKGEIAMLKMISDLHYGDPDCPIQARDDYPKDQLLMFEVELLDFMPVKLVTDDAGVTKQVLAEGNSWETGRPPYEAKVWLTGWVYGGTKFLSCNSGQPFHFVFGKNEIPVGLEKGIGTMVRGEKAIIYISKAYVTAASSIQQLAPETEEVVFEVELIQLIQVRDVLGNGGVIKRRIRDGKGDFPMDCPLEDSVLRIHYKGTLPDEGGRVFCDTRVDNEGQPLEFSSGEGQVPEGLELSCKLMLPEEVSVICCLPQYAYDKFPRPSNVPEGARIQWEVELLGFEKLKDWTGLNFREIMSEADKIKGTGNRLFKEGKYELAKAKYDKVLRDFNHVHPKDDAESKELLDVKAAIQLNVAACLYNLQEHIKCIDLCNKVVDGNPLHAKAYYRRGLAYTATGDFAEAKADFIKMLELDKNTEAAAKTALAKLKKREQESELRARKQFKGLFDKKPGELSEVEKESNIIAQRISPDTGISTKEKISTKAANVETSQTNPAGQLVDKEEPVSKGSASFLAAAKVAWKRSFFSKCTVL